MHHEQRAFAVFTWDGDMPAFDATSNMDLLSGKAPAELIFGALQSQGYVPLSDSLIEGELGWHIDLKLATHAFDVYTQWNGARHERCFNVEVGLKRGIFATLFGKRVQVKRLEPACIAVDKAFALLPQIKEVEWMSDRQFRVIY